MNDFARRTPTNELRQMIAELDSKIPKEHKVDQCFKWLEIAKFASSQAYQISRTFTGMEIEEYVRRS